MSFTLRVPIEVRFWQRVVKTETCWFYGGKQFGNKYGLLSSGGRGSKSIGAHKFSYQLHKGEVPRGKFVCHTCDVKNCVNPEHLYAGDHEDNNNDRVKRQRSKGNTKTRIGLKNTTRENANGRALSIDQRRDLVAEYNDGKFTQVQLAKRYRTSQSTVSATIRGKRNMGAGGSVNASRKGYYKCKLTEEQRNMIVLEYKSGGITQAKLAQKYGCDQTYVSLLCKC